MFWLEQKARPRGAVRAPEDSLVDIARPFESCRHIVGPREFQAHGPRRPLYAIGQQGTTENLHIRHIALLTSMLQYPTGLHLPHTVSKINLGISGQEPQDVNPDRQGPVWLRRLYLLGVALLKGQVLPADALTRVRNWGCGLQPEMIPSGFILI